jgi:hypothetical protein
VEYQATLCDTENANSAKVKGLHPMDGRPVYPLRGILGTNEGLSARFKLFANWWTQVQNALHQEWPPRSGRMVCKGTIGPTDDIYFLAAIMRKYVLLFYTCHAHALMVMLTTAHST